MTYIAADIDISEARFNQAWRSEHGSMHATVRLTSGAGARLYLDSAEDARAIAAACTEAAEALDRLGESDPGARCPETSDSFHCTGWQEGVHRCCACGSEPDDELEPAQYDPAIEAAGEDPS